jgi:dihydrofolate reductase
MNPKKIETSDLSGLPPPSPTKLENVSSWIAKNSGGPNLSATSASNGAKNQWADTTVLSGDVAAAVGELKGTPPGELQVHGSGSLVRWLFDRQLVDEIILLIYPVVVGQGTRLFPDTGRDCALDLVESRVTPSGVTIQVYRPSGRPEYAT